MLLPHPITTEESVAEEWVYPCIHMETCNRPDISRDSVVVIEMRSLHDPSSNEACMGSQSRECGGRGWGKKE